MSGKKRNSTSQIIGARGERIAEDAFPDNWIVRKIPQDFGIDLSVEVFAPTPTGGVFETTGQHLQLQVKSKATPFRSQIIDNSPFICLEVEPSLINTVRAMGPAVPFLLLAVEVQTRSIYWVCLNDYIDKVLPLGIVPPKKIRSSVKRPTGKPKPKKLTIAIPESNRLTSGSSDFELIEAISQRPKLMAAFVLAHNSATSALGWSPLHNGLVEHWKQQLTPVIGKPQVVPARWKQIDEMIRALETLLHMDIWKRTHISSYRWEELPYTRAVVFSMMKALSGLRDQHADPNGILVAHMTRLAPTHPLFAATHPPTTSTVALLDNLQLGFRTLSNLGFGYDKTERTKSLGFTL